ncbi:MAG: MOSC domain-containing protein [Aquisalinus sp.]|nr:MOSC domain-containing protein [Aquisalinus sp.]
MIVKSLHIYPLKSARGLSLSSSVVTPAGLSGDRQLMIIDEQARFVTQREYSQLAKINVQARADSYEFSFDDGQAVSSPTPDGSRRTSVQVWRSMVDAAVFDEDINQKLSSWLGKSVKLVMFDDVSARSANPDWAGYGTPIQFSDAYPVLVTTTGSLKTLNDDLERQGHAIVPMDRFRSNIVIDHDEPWSEDYWSTIEINGLRFDLVKPSDRCIVTTQDQRSGETGHGDPMPALRHLRMSADARVKGVLFGWNTAPRGTGEIRVGDRVKIIDKRVDGWPLRDFTAT